MGTSGQTKVKFYNGEQIPLELHKVRIVQKLHLRPVEVRYKAMDDAGYNTFLLDTSNIFLDMLTDSGVNAMSDHQIAAMMTVDDSYAGSATFTRLQDKLVDIFDKLDYSVSFYSMYIKDLLVARRTAEDQFVGVNAGKK